MKSREVRVLIFNSTVSREVSGTNYTPTRAITYTYIYIYVCIYVSRIPLNLTKSVSLASLARP